jgi:hypothetical protein
MNLTPEQAQKLTDLQRRMLENTRNNRPAAHGISQEELTEGLAFTRMHKASAKAAGDAKSAAKGTKKKKAPAEASAAMSKLLGGLDLD